MIEGTFLLPLPQLHNHTWRTEDGRRGIPTIRSSDPYETITMKFAEGEGHVVEFYEYDRRTNETTGRIVVVTVQDIRAEQPADQTEEVAHA